ncbi:MAG: carbohydrate binding domain-containing protein [Anaerolineae bacterium]|nr:carbohydrate binding domain-containing protein [Anaerolineae bacterium]
MKQYREFHWIHLLLALGLASLGMSILSVGLQVHAAPGISFDNIVETSWLNLRRYAPTKADNLAPNPGFEIDEPGNPGKPEHWIAIQESNAEFLRSTDSHSGTYAVLINNAGTTAGSGMWKSDAVGVIANNTYTFSGWVKHSSRKNGYCALQIAFYDADGGLLGFNETKLTEMLPDWTLVTVNAIAPENAITASLQAYMSGKMAVLFDDVSLTSSSTPIPILRLKVNDEPDPVDASATLTYTLLVSNTGIANETGFTVTLSLNENLSYGSTAPPPSVVNGQQLIWSNPGMTLAPGAVHIITVTSQLLGGLAHGLELSSFATVTGRIASTNVIDEVVTTVRSEPHIELSKTAPAVMDAGENLTYTIRLTNTGNAIAEGVVFAEDYPDTCFQTTGLPVLWTVGDLAPGENFTAVVSAPVVSSCPNETILYNEVVADAEDYPGQVSAFAQTLVESTYNIPVWKLVLRAPEPDQVWPHEPSTYLFQLRNDGNMVLRNIGLTVSDRLGWPAEHFVISPESIGSLPKGEMQTISVTVTSPACTPSGLLNVLTLAASSTVTINATSELTLTVGVHQDGDLQDAEWVTLPPAGHFALARSITNTGNTTTTFWLRNRSVPSGLELAWTPNQTLTLGPCMSESRDLTLDYVGDFRGPLMTELYGEFEPDVFCDSIVDVLEVEAYFDAMLGAAVAPVPVLPGQTFTLSHWLTNTGNVTTAFVLAASDSLGWDLAVSPTLVSQLAPSQGHHVEVTGTFFGCIVSGTINPVVLTATPQGTASPVATATTPVAVGRWTGAQLSPGKDYIVAPTQVLTITHQLVNTGSATTSFRFSGAAPAGWGLVWNPDTILLDPCGGTATIYGGVMHPTVDKVSATLTTTVALADVPGIVVAQAMDQVQVKWRLIYLPLVLRMPPLPAAPVIEPINNLDIDGEYLIQWNAPAYAVSYILEQADNAAFTSATVIAQGAEMQHSVTIANAAAGAYYYRVRACNETPLCGPWSEAVSVEAWYEHEPNDKGLPNGPLTSGMTYYGRPDFYQGDRDDYYLVNAGAGQITVQLTGFTGKGGWLLMYYDQVHLPPAEASMPIRADGTAELSYNGAAGAYYVRVYTESGFNDVPYNLTVTFPQAQQHVLSKGLLFR